MALSQTVMDRVARKIRTAHGNLGQSITVYHRTTAQEAPTILGPFVIPRPQQPGEQELAMAALAGDRPLVLASDRYFLLPTAETTWAPTIYDEILDASGNRWRVLGLTDGPGHPFWRLQCRLVRQEHA